MENPVKMADLGVPPIIEFMVICIIKKYTYTYCIYIIINIVILLQVTTVARYTHKSQNMCYNDNRHHTFLYYSNYYV